MNRYKTSSRKLLKFPRKFFVAASAPTSESAAVRPTVTTRRPRVGRTFRNESTALIRVSEPPYMFSAVTETRPSVARMSTIAPKPVKTWSPTWSSSAMAVPLKFLPAQAASTEPTIIIQAPPIAEPQ
jgi:hypothetical protein